MEAMVTIVAIGTMLLFLVFAGMAIVLVIGASLVGLVGGIAHLLQDLVHRSGQAECPRARDGFLSHIDP